MVTQFLIPKIDHKPELLPNSKIVVSVSSGASSAVAAEICLNLYGAARVGLVFCDTLVEDDDNYRFLDECEVRWQSLFGIKGITRIVEGRTPLEVAEDEHIIPNQKIAPCTKRLKIIPFVNYIKTLQAQSLEVIVALGMGHNELHRCESPRKNYAKVNASVIYPLLWQDNQDPVEVVKAWGIDPPRMYDLSDRVDGLPVNIKDKFKHANCGGNKQSGIGGCVKMGKREWTLYFFWKPDYFMAVEAWEKNMRLDPRFEDYAILRHTENGVMRPYTLEELRKHIESQSTVKQLELWQKRADIEDTIDGRDCGVECGVANFEIEDIDTTENGANQLMTIQTATPPPAPPVALKWTDSEVQAVHAKERALNKELAGIMALTHIKMESAKTKGVWFAKMGDMLIYGKISASGIRVGKTEFIYGKESAAQMRLGYIKPYILANTAESLTAYLQHLGSRINDAKQQRVDLNVNKNATIAKKSLGDDGTKRRL